MECGLRFEISNKLIMLGIDGATWNIIKSQADKGNLSTFKKLMDNGVWSDSESCIPPLTASAWTCIATGKNPGKTGIFDFFSRVSKSHLETRAFNSYKIKRARPLWDFLSENDYRMGIWNYPFLFAVYKIDGFMVSGYGIFFAYGPNINQNHEIKARIYGIAPTILHMFGLPVPDDMDGRVLKEIFREGSEPARREVQYQKVDLENERVKGSIRKLKELGSYEYHSEIKGMPLE